MTEKTKRSFDDLYTTNEEKKKFLQKPFEERRVKRMIRSAIDNLLITAETAQATADTELEKLSGMNLDSWNKAMAQAEEAHKAVERLRRLYKDLFGKELKGDED